MRRPSRHMVAGGLLLLAVVLLVADLLIRPAVPTPWLLVRFGVLGGLLPVLLTLAGVEGILRRPPRSAPRTGPPQGGLSREEEKASSPPSGGGERQRAGGDSRIASVAFLALLFVPAVVVDDWVVPVAYIARWAAAGSPDGIVGLAFAALGLVAVLADLLLRAFPRAGHVSGRLLAGVALGLPWGAAALHPWLYHGAGTGRLALSAALHTAAFGLYWQGRRLVRAAVTPSASLRAWGEAVLDVVPIALVLVVLFVFKLETLSYSATDENIYFYAIRLFTQGRLPYRDYFFAHPPLHVFVPGLLSLVFGHGFFFFKLLSVFFSVGSGLFVFLTVRHGSGRGASLVAAVLFLFAHEQLQASTNLTGINLTTFFLTLAAWLAVRGRAVWSGVSAAAAALSGIYAVGPVLALPAVLFWRSWRRGTTWLAVFAGTFGAANLLCRVAFGPAFWQQVYVYHFLKPAAAEGFRSPGAAGLTAVGLAGLAFLVACAVSGELSRLDGPWRRRLTAGMQTRSVQVLTGIAGGFVLACLVVGGVGEGGLGLLWHNLELFVHGKEFLRIFYFHPHLVLAPVAFAGSLVAAWGAARLLPGTCLPPLRDAALTGGVLYVASFCELALLRETYTFYYVLFLPGAAILAGLAWSLAPVTLAGLRGRAGETPWRAAGRGAVSLGLAAVLVTANTVHTPVGLAVGHHRFPEEKEHAGELVCYDIKQNVNTPFSRLIREHILPSCRFRGSTEPGLHHYLWKKKWYFSRADEIARYIRTHSEPGETIVGSSLVTPLLALLSGREIAAGYVDTNSKRFKSGMLQDGRAWVPICDQRPQLDEAACRRIAAEWEMWQAVCRTPVRFIVAGPRSMFTPRRMQRHPVVRRYFKPVGVFNEPNLNMRGRYPVVLYRRVSDEPLPDGSWCGLGDGAGGSRRTGPR